MKKLCQLVTFFFITTMVPTTFGAVEFINSPDSRKLGLPFSDAVRVDNMVILSGQLGVDASTFQLVNRGIVPETRQIFSNMSAILKQAGGSLDDVVKCTVMMADIAEWPKFNEIYVTYFPQNKPARSAFQAAGLALNARVEMECWANIE